MQDGTTEMNEAMNVNEPDLSGASLATDAPEQILLDHIEKVDKEAKEGLNDQNIEPTEGGKEKSSGESKREAREKESQASEEAEEAGLKVEEKDQVAPEETGEAYTPNLSYKHLREQREMPKELAGIIKTKEQEDYYRGVFNKADGFDFVQDKRQKAEAELNQVYGTFDEFMKNAKIGDFKKAWTETAGLPSPTLQQVLNGFGFGPKDIIQHAYDLANQTPEEAKAQTAQLESEKRYNELQMRVNDMESAHQRQMEQAVYTEYDQVYQDQETRPIIEAFEAHNGKGSFFREVAQRGVQLGQETGKIYGPRAIANEIIDRYNLRNLVGQPAQITNQNTSPMSQTAPGTNPANQPVQGQKKRGEPAIIPAIDSAGGSPGQRAIRTPEDLEKIARDELGLSISF